MSLVSVPPAPSNDSRSLAVKKVLAYGIHAAETLSLVPWMYARETLIAAVSLVLHADETESRIRPAVIASHVV